MEHKEQVAAEAFGYEDPPELECATYKVEQLPSLPSLSFPAPPVHMRAVVVTSKVRENVPSSSVSFFISAGN